MVTGSVEFGVEELSKAEALRGNLAVQHEEEKLMHSVLENDKDTVKKGKLVSDALNQGFSSFVPDMLFDNLAKNYSMAQHLYGESMIRLLSGYEPSCIKKNINIPEFRRELRKKIEEKSDELRKDGLIEKDGTITERGIKLASLVLYTEELDNLVPKGLLGKKEHKENFIYGEKSGVKGYRKGDRYRDIAIKNSVKAALRRGHTKLFFDDLKSFERQSRGSVYIVYAMDASGSMKGKKIEISKKAGIALAFRAISQRDKVGLIVFGTDIREKIMPTLDFLRLIRKIAAVKASKETNITQTIKESIAVFPRQDATKHLILLTDALPTIGKEPEKETLEAVSEAVCSGITISLIGISLDRKGKAFAEKLTRIGNGRLYVVKDLENIDRIILEDYYAVIG